MSERFLHVLAGDAEADLTGGLQRAGFHVSRSNRKVGGINVWVRADTNDEADARRLVQMIAPGASYGPPSTPTHYIEGYREDA